jgi:hypothetical protein
MYYYYVAAFNKGINMRKLLAYWRIDNVSLAVHVTHACGQLTTYAG